jgi:hypothetical protein
MTAQEKVDMDAARVAEAAAVAADRAEILTKIQQAKTLYLDWDTATPAQKDAYLKEMGRAVWILGRLTIQLQVSDDPNAP